ncbi:uncharacterized protein LOC129762794 [Toxorhynchites rutilus septentrionalis]|uniref:uncharacterized protein LOC129762794 n=1 Tax=Toxorhynchites rutilus septentrionalis TaxID=329112 RepID=UPI002478DAFD|nr:uncharacterized protein LOC129762794 [Toxorhynchites rutilus septentrionalis]
MSVFTNSTTFFQSGTSAQFEYVLGLYPQALRLRAEKRGTGKKSEKLIRLDEWYQNTLPKLIKSRGKDAHLVHEELVQTMEWKQTRGKFYPQLTHLIKINTPRAVYMETKKAFRKLPNLEQALNALSNLKGVGITMASALLAAALPESAPFMADECLMAVPDFESIDYTAKEYLKFVASIQQTMDRLNKEIHAGGDETESNGAEENGDGKVKKWTAHNVELALWAHYVAVDLQPELLKDMPESNGVVAAAASNGSSLDADHDENSQNGAPSDESNMDSDTVLTNGNTNVDSMDGSENGTVGELENSAAPTANDDAKDLPADSLDDCTKSGDSLDEPPAVKATTAAVASLCTADAEVAVDSDSQSSNSQKRPLYCDNNSDEQPEISAPKLLKL